jgi:hypothetical protein
MAYIFGIATFSFTTPATGFTTTILGTYDVDAGTESKELRDNSDPPAVVAVRIMKNAETIGLHIIGFGSAPEPETLTGADMAATLRSVAYAGTCTHAKETGTNGDWTTYDVEFKKVPA